MKKTLSLIFLTALLLSAVTPCIGATQQNNASAQQDNTIDVIGWFCERDTAIYWIQDGAWRVNNGDTIQTAGLSTKVMITVTDSTATGYKIDYTFLDVRSDTLSNSEVSNIHNKIAGILAKKMLGTTIRFETDEYGEIVKFNNLDKIKKQAKSMCNDVIKYMEEQPWAKELKDIGLNLNDYKKNIDPDILVEQYLEDIKLLFVCFGNSYDIGESTEKNEATETQYASETYRNATIDDDGYYSILTEVMSTIPKTDLKTLMAGIVDNIKDQGVKDSFEKNFETEVNTECTVDSFLQLDYFPNGWPYKLLKQESTTIGDIGKTKQKYIYLDTYSFYNN
jgi:hypothetical protein